MKFRTASKALLLIPLLAGAAFVAAATLVNINTADSATLQTLNGIGPSKAQAIIDYRTQHGSFAKIEDIQNVSGIGPATYANIKDYITVGGSAAVAQPVAQDSTSTQQPAVQQTSNTGALPPTITAKITTSAQALAGAGTMFDGAAYNSAGEPLNAGVRYVWNFGDGATAEGQHALHTYRYPGTYSVSLDVAYNFSSAGVRLSLPVVVPQIDLVAEGDGSLTIYNQSSSDIDVGLWSLVDGSAKPFVIPQDTVVIAKQGVRFGAAATGLPGSRDAVLLYPNGTQAASAVVGQRSSLRGEQVVVTPAARTVISAPAQPQTVAATGTQTLAAAATASPAAPNMPWLPFGGLAALLAAGGAGAWYAGALPKRRPETPDASEEFEIE